MDRGKFISDEEWLYRSVRNQEGDEYYFDDDGRLIIKSGAFRDKNKEPSVDRAKLRNFDPSLSKLNNTDGIVGLNTYRVRSIGDINTKGNDESIVLHSVDAVYDPTAENLAHSKITVDPEFFGTNSKQKRSFRLLQISLARLASENGWTLEPGKKN